MRKITITSMIFAVLITAKSFSQNPFESIGVKNIKVLTFSNGKFNEFFDNDTIVQIGSVLYNTKSNEIVAFVERDTTYSEATLKPEITSRWLSPDPLAAKFPAITPYAYGANNPIFFIDPDGRAVKPSTGDARTLIQSQLNTFNQNATLSQIFGGASYGQIGTYNDPNGGNPSQGQPISGFSLSGMSYGAAQRLLNADQTGLSSQQKLEALSWVRALGALDVAEVGVYNSSQTTVMNNPQVGQAGQITDNSFVTSNPAMGPFMNAMTNAGNNAVQQNAAINTLVTGATGASGIPFLPNGSPGTGVAAPNITSPTNQTLNIVGLYPVAGTATNGATGVSNAIVNFGVSQGGVSVSDQNNVYRMTPNATMTTTPK